MRSLILVPWKPKSSAWKVLSLPTGIIVAVIRMCMKAVTAVVVYVRWTSGCMFYKLIWMAKAIWSRYEIQPPPCRCSQAARTTPSLLVTSLCWPCHLFGGVPDAAGTQVSQPQGFTLEPVVAYLNGCSDFYLFTFEHRQTCFRRPLNDCLTQGCYKKKKLWQFNLRFL